MYKSGFFIWALYEKSILKVAQCKTMLYISNKKYLVMTYFTDIQERNELKSLYRRLSLLYHPDKGGQVEKMKAINQEYNMLKHTFGIFPNDLRNVKVGNFVYVNKSLCLVTKVENKLFYAKSFKTGRVAMFAKDTGYGVFNFKIRAYASK